MNERPPIDLRNLYRLIELNIAVIVINLIVIGFNLWWLFLR